jgi:hypothetical protein
LKAAHLLLSWLRRIEKIVVLNNKEGSNDRILHNM